MSKKFDKYYYYSEAVQSPEADVEFLRKTYRQLRGNAPKVLREDFCAAFLNCCEWVKQGPKFKAIGLDLDPETLEYGEKNYWSKLTESQKKRVQWKKANVLSPGLPKADIIAAMNFSHFIFKKREQMKQYFRRCYESLNRSGILVADCFGGSDCQAANEEIVDHKKFKYYWDQTNFNPITNEALFYIHFKLKGEAKRREKVFTYDWRLWSIQELREIMEEVGFKKTTVYWEGTTRSGDGDGKFKPSSKGEECEAWVAYVVGQR